MCGMGGSGTTYEEHASQLCNKECETNSHGGDESSLVLFRGEHEDCEDELCREEHFDDWKNCQYKKLSSAHGG